MTDNTRYGILSILILFIIGGGLFMTVNLKEGERIAKEYLVKTTRIVQFLFIFFF